MHLAASVAHKVLACARLRARAQGFVSDVALVDVAPEQAALHQQRQGVEQSGPANQRAANRPALLKQLLGLEWLALIHYHIKHLKSLAGASLADAAEKLRKRISRLSLCLQSVHYRHKINQYARVVQIF